MIKMLRYHEFLSKDGLYERIAFRSGKKYRLRECFKGRLSKLQNVLDIISYDKNGSWGVSSDVVPIKESLTVYENKGYHEIFLEFLVKADGDTFVKCNTEKIQDICVPAGVSLNIRDPGYDPKSYIARSETITGIVSKYGILQLDQNSSEAITNLIPY